MVSLRTVQQGAPRLFNRQAISSKIESQPRLRLN